MTLKTSRKTNIESNSIAPVDKIGAALNGTTTAAATATPVQPGPTPGPPHVNQPSATVAGSTSPVGGVVSSPTVDVIGHTNDTKLNIGLDSVMETQAAQLNLLLYQIYRPYFNGKHTFTKHVFKRLDISNIIKQKFAKRSAKTYVIFTYANILLINVIRYKAVLIGKKCCKSIINVVI